CEPGALCLGTRFLLRLVAEWKPEPVEEARIEPREHVRLVFVGVCRARGEEGRMQRCEHVRLVFVVVCRAREQMAVATADDARVVPGRKPRRAGALGEGEQLGEAKAAVARDARVRRLAARVPADERRDDRAAELLAQAEGKGGPAEPLAQ